jgi:hypothetical protein
MEHYEGKSPRIGNLNSSYERCFRGLMV